MKRNLMVAAMVLFTGSLFAADSGPENDVASAAKKLAEASNYSWKTTADFGPDARFTPGPTTGKTEKDGFTVVTMSFRDNTTEMVLKGDKGAVNTPDNGWQSLADLENAQGRERFFARRIQSFKAPAAQASELAGQVKALKKEGDVYSGDLTEAGAKSLLRFGRGRGGGGGPEVSNAKGSVKFWLKDGALAKFEVKVQGSVSFNGNERDIDRTTTTEITDVGTTKVKVPDEAKKKLS